MRRRRRRRECLIEKRGRRNEGSWYLSANRPGKKQLPREHSGSQCTFFVLCQDQRRFAITVVGISGRRGVSSIRDRANVIDKQVKMKRGWVRIFWHWDVCDMCGTQMTAVYRESLECSSQVVWNQVRKLRFVNLLRAGKHNFSTTYSQNLGRAF